MSLWHIGETRAVLDGVEGAVRWRGSRSPGSGIGLIAAPDGKRIAFLSRAHMPDSRKFSTIVQDALGERPPVTLSSSIVRFDPQGMSFTPDGQSLATLTTGNRVAVFDASNGNLRRSFPVQANSAHFALSPTGRWLAVVSRCGVNIHDFTTGELLYALPDREGTAYWLAWQPGEPRLAIARDNGDIAIWDLAKIERQLTELGLGVAPVPTSIPPAKDKP